MSRRTGRGIPRALGAALALILLCPGLGWAAKVVATVDRNPVTAGVGVVLSVTVSGQYGKASEPDLPESLRRRFEVYSNGTSRQFSMINGRTETSLTYRYTVVVDEPGEVVIEPISVVVDGKRERTQPITLVVQGRQQVGRPRSSGATSGGESTEDVLLEAVVDREEVVEGEEIILTIKFYHRVRLIDRPEFEPPATTGFVTERLPEVPIQEVLIDGVVYSLQEIRYALFPLGSGQKGIGSARVVATVPRRGRRDPFSVFGSWFDGREVTVASEPLSITVRPLPATTDPDFSGAVGRFSMTASTDVATVNQNDPVTLTIEITGVGNLGSAGEVAAPDLAEFRVFDASSELDPRVIGGRLGGTRTVQRVFVPLREGDHEIPEVRFTYFDTDSRRYRTLTAGPFPVEVRVAPDGGPGRTALVVGKGEVKVLGEDVRFIHTDIPRFQRVGQSGSRLRWAVHVVPLLAVGLALVWRRRQDRLATDVAYHRSRHAARRARERLREAASRGEEAPSAVWAAVAGYVADRLNAPSAALTGGEASTLLLNVGCPAELAERVKTLGERCDFARFAPAGTTDPQVELRADGEAVIKALEREPLGRGSRGRAA